MIKDSLEIVTDHNLIVFYYDFQQVKLEPLSNFETQVAAGRAWRERTARVFLKKNGNAALLDVLCPRTDVGNQESRRKNKKTKDDLSGIQHPIFQGLTQKEMLDRKVISKAFKDAEIKEIQVSC